MARHTTPTADQVAAWEAWVADRPPTIRDVIAKHRLDPWTLYRLTSTNQRVFLISVSESGRVRIGVTGEFNLVMSETAVFGIDPAELEECDLPSADERLGSLELTVEEIRRLTPEDGPHYVAQALLTRPLKTYPRAWPKGSS